jgi:hypothetical protein
LIGQLHNVMSIQKWEISTFFISTFAMLYHGSRYSQGKDEYQPETTINLLRWEILSSIPKTSMQGNLCFETTLKYHKLFIIVLYQIINLHWSLCRILRILLDFISRYAWSLKKRFNVINILYTVTNNFSSNLEKFRMANVEIKF